MRVRSRAPSSIGGIPIPADPVSRATWAWAQGRLPRYLFAHSVRSYCWGVTLALDDGIESVLLDRATGIDVRGTEFAAIDGVRDAVVAELPRRDFDRSFLAAIRREVAARPGCQSERLLPRLEVDGRVANSPWHRGG